MNENIECDTEDVPVLNTLAGKIEVLQLTNFMCHSNLELKFNPRINFITGRNGSGKSAIMTALIVVLGGTATVTGRGSKLSDLIKKEENWAKITITLLNDGINSFKKEHYGSKIIISRTISKTESNSYTCKSANGSIVSRKKEEVDNIVMAFNWQLKNPLCVLNQDVARSFLCTSDNEMRFTMFTRATQLEHLKTVYMKTTEILAATKKQLQGKEKGVEKAYQEILELKEKLSQFVSLEKHVHQRRDLENEYIWSLVVQEENEFKKLNLEKTSLEKKKKLILELENNFESVLEKLDLEIKECKKKIEKSKSVEEENKETNYNIRSKVHELEKQIMKGEAQLKVAMEKAERNKSDINSVKEHLKNDDANFTENEKERKKNCDKIDSLQSTLSSLKDQIAVTQKDYDAAQETKVHLARAMEILKSDYEELEENKRKLEIMSKNIKSNGHNNLLKYGPFTQELVKAIDNAFRKNLFHKKPVGPCGVHVTLSGDPKWAKAIESVVGGLMLSYCCDSQKDFQVLAKIMDKVCGEKQPGIIISKFLPSRHNVESKRVILRDHPSVLDVLTFDNDIVYNTFIDQARIETIILFESDQQAASLMTHIQNVPKNLNMGLTLAGDQYFPAPNYRTYYGNLEKVPSFFGNTEKNEDILKKLETELKVAYQSLEKKNEEMVKARKEGMEIMEALKKFQTNIRDLKQKERKIQVDLAHLKDIEDSRPVTITRAALEEELVILQKCFEESSLKVAQCKEAVSSLQQQKNEYIVQLNAGAINKMNVDEELKKIKTILEEKIQDQKRLLIKKKDTSGKLSEVDQKLESIQSEIIKCEAKVKSKREEAEEVCPNQVDTDKSPIEVQKLLEKCKRYLQTAEKMVGSKEDTIQEYKTKFEAFKVMKKMVEILTSTMEVLVKTMRHKSKRLISLQMHTANLVSFYFQAILRTRGYDGQLKIDFDKKLLELEVTTKGGKDSRKDSKTLSGGERSYSTVSFILAIWKVVNMPVYFLDEFDVFMDKVNRKVIMDLLLEHANVQSNKQFVFITPQDISSIQASEIISVYRLPNPKRKSED